YLELSSKLAAFAARITDFSFTSVEVTYAGDIGKLDTRVLTQAALKGVLSSHMEEVNYVNAPVIARKRGISVTERKVEEHEDYSSLLEITLSDSEGRRNTVWGTLLGKREPRLLGINRIKVEAKLSEHMLFVQNYDRPGVIAQIAGVFSRRGINIGGMHFGREKAGGDAVSLLEVDNLIEDEVIREVEGLPNIIKVRRVELL
ncbi:MAG: ACT domain-containing protein, partial [Candidatus Bathyarchaeia archaeon]